MAADYIESIQSVQRHGPYFLGGWSLGGIIAFEMARQLRQQGESIGLLGVFDAGAMPEDRQADGEEFVQMLMDLFPHEAKISLEQIDAMTPEKQIECFCKRASQAQLLGLETDGKFARIIFEVFKAGITVMSRIPAATSSRKDHPVPLHRRHDYVQRPLTTARLGRLQSRRGRPPDSGQPYSHDGGAGRPPFGGGAGRMP